MEYPKDPTVLPSAQRHTETYHADQGRVFTDGDVISIQIPPTNHSYLTKDAQLHFTFDMDYYEGTDENYSEIVGNLNLDNGSPTNISFTSANNDLVFTGTTGLLEIQDVPRTLTVNEVADAFNDSSTTSPYRVVYDDSLNKFSVFYGIRITQVASLLFYTIGGSPPISTVIPEGVYAINAEGDSLGVSGIMPTFNGKDGYLILEYNLNSDKKFTLRAADSQLRNLKIKLKAISSDFLTKLGWNAFISDKTSTNITLLGGEGFIADSPVDLGSVTVALDATSTALTALGLTSGNFTKNVLGTQYKTGTAIPKPSPTTAATHFFEQLIYTEQTSGKETSTPTSETIPILYRPYPTLDVNGPYSFFNSLEVYDYLGNTLLEKIPDHDLLTAIWADLENSTETTQQILRYPEIDSRTLITITKPNCSYLITDNPNSIYSSSPAVSTDNFTTEENVTAAKLSLPSIHFGINLYSFLGKLSEKFVPLHNGFTVKFFLNRRERVIAFNTQQPNNKISYNVNGTIGYETYMKPFITKYAFSNVYLRGDIVTVPPELDGRIDKIVFAKGYKTQAGVPQNRCQRINTEVKSLTSVVIAQQQPSDASNLSTMRHSAFIRNYCPGAKLLYNKATVSQVSNFDEAYRNFRNTFGCPWNPYVQRNNWESDEPLTDSSWMQVRMIDKSYLGFAVANDKFYKDVSVPLGPLPRYLLTFDTRLPGYTPMAVCGIDTRKQLLEVQLETTTKTQLAAPVTMISEFDTFIEIKPSESSAVSF